MSSILGGKNIVLGITGGIAAYKAAELLRLLTGAGASVRVVMTRNAQWFVGRTTFEALSGKPVFSDMFDESGQGAIRHIDWAQEADAVIVAPATANIVGKLANGIADDTLSTFLMVVTAPKIVCPAMNTNMYESRAVQRNLDRLRQDRVTVIAPDAGNLACGTVGPGRLPDPAVILDRVICRLIPKDFAGKTVVVTAGPTREYFDPVRFISNPSTGKMGYVAARAAEHRGARVVLISGPTALQPPLNVETVLVETAAEMADNVYARAENADVVIKTAAVGDYRPASRREQKMKKEDDTLSIDLAMTDDILLELGRRKKEGQVLAGFAAETESLEENAEQKLRRKNLDLIAANLLGAADSGFGTDTNRVTLFFRSGQKVELPTMEKSEVAHAILDRIREIIDARTAVEPAG